MKIKSNVGHNVSFHKVPTSTSKNIPAYLTIPAGSTLELDDALWLDAYAGASGIAKSLETGALVLLEDAVSPLSKDEIVEAIRDQVGVAVDPSKGKAEIQSLASKLGVNLKQELVAESDEESEESFVDDED